MIAATARCGARGVLAAVLLTAWGMALSPAVRSGAPAEAHEMVLNPLDMDTTIAPGDDFFAYANGAWLKKAVVPAAKGAYDVGDILEDRTVVDIAAIVQKAAQSPAPAGSDLRLVGDYYAAYMDQDGIEARGPSAIEALRNEIYAIHDRHELALYLGGTLRADVDVLNADEVHTDRLFGLWIAQDFDHPDQYVPFLLQGGLGMPDRSYYLDASAPMADLRAKYTAHVAAMLSLAGLSQPAARARRITDLERRIATVHATRDVTEDVRKGNNRWLRKEFHRKAPGLEWGLFFNGARLPFGQQEFIAWQPLAISGIASLVTSESLAAWKDYLFLHAIERRAEVLPKAFLDEHFAFYGRVLGGKMDQQARWRQSIDATNEALADAVGRLYVARHFAPEAKARVEVMAEQIRSAFRARIERLSWLSPASKAAAQAKLAALRIGVGYPDQWRDYADLKVLRDDAYGNAERASLFEYHHQLAKLGQPVDRAEWVVSPQTPNCVNLPALNAINLSAAYLQSPSYDPDGDAAANFGALGNAIGHEVLHSFDDQGALFDPDRRLRPWWSAAEVAHFTAAGEPLVAQYSAYQALPDLKVNGRLTLSENIADLAGIEVALDAYRQQAQGNDTDTARGYTGEQRFFLAYAQAQRGKYTESTLRLQLMNDGHAPNEYRADTVRNVDAWYEAFSVKPGQALYLAPAQRVRIW
jgi:putative endopeptidase